MRFIVFPCCRHRPLEDLFGWLITMCPSWILHSLDAYFCQYAFPHPFFTSYLSLTNSAQKLEWICFHSNNKRIGSGPCSVKLCSIHSGTSLSRYFSLLRLRARVSFTIRTLTSRSLFTITLTGLHLLSVDSTCFASRTRLPRAKLLPLFTNALGRPFTRSKYQHSKLQ